MRKETLVMSTLLLLLIFFSFNRVRSEENILLEYSYLVDISPGSINEAEIIPVVGEVRAGGSITLSGIIYTETGATFTQGMQQQWNRDITTTWCLEEGTGTIVVFQNENRAVFYASSEEGTCTIRFVAEELPVQIQDPKVPETTYTISTQSITLVATATIVVITPKPNRIQVEPTSLSIEAGGTATIVSRVYDQWNQPMSVPSIFNSNVGTFTVTVGTCTVFEAQTKTTTGWITANVNGLYYATATIQIVPGPLAEIIITPTSATLTLGGTKTFFATGYDLYGNIRGTDSFQWQVEHPFLGTITIEIGTATVFVATSTGAGGTTTITAQKQGIAGIASVRVLESFIRAIGTQTAGVPFEIELQFSNPEYFSQNITIRDPLEGVVGSIEVDEEGKGKGTITLFRAGTHTLHAVTPDNLLTVVSNDFLVKPGKITKGQFYGPGVFIAGRDSSYCTVTVKFLDEWDNEAPIPPRTEGRYCISFSGVLFIDNDSVDETVSIFDRWLTYPLDNKIYLPPGRTQISLPDPEEGYDCFFKKHSDEVDRLITTGNGNYIKLYALLEKQ